MNQKNLETNKKRCMTFTALKIQTHRSTQNIGNFQVNKTIQFWFTFEGDLRLK